MSKTKEDKKATALKGRAATMQKLAESMPTSILIFMLDGTIQMLAQRGVYLRDWDNRDKIVRSVRVLGGRYYFFATKNEPTEVHANGHIDSE